jgi:hypothetical protein
MIPHPMPAAMQPKGPSRSWRGTVHAAATVLVATTLAGDLATRPKPSPSPSIPAPDTRLPTIQPTAAENDIRAAWEIEEPADRAQMKRLLYLYRGTVKAAQKAKTIGELQALFGAEEARLAMKGKLPHLRMAVARQWPAATVPGVEISDGMRGQIIGFLEKMIGVLEKL